MGGNPEATATPSDKGNAIRKTRKPASMSERQNALKWLGQGVETEFGRAEFGIRFPWLFR